jgi:phenylalanyl-tRNA synthetase beta chain
MGAFEVEEIKKVGPNIQGDVVVGEILDIRKHPDAEKIRLTTVRISENEEPRQIVCGAWNIEVGHRIPVALPGAKVLNRLDGKELAIKESKIRGEISRGMLCSAPELGIAGSGEGILILDVKTPIGANAKELLNIQDSVLHVGTRSNRGDALCVLGLAREVAALLARPLREPNWKLPAESAGAEPFAVEVADSEGCPFFTIRVLLDLKVGPSPEWMVRRLEAIGMRTINNVVDITNYVMQELGQPLHAYDMAQLQDNYLQTRRARAGEKLTTIDDRERDLTEEVLIIADRAKPVGIAGVMGGKGSEITETTSIVALEAACFNSARVRRSSRLLGLSSDSSLRFERGVDIASVRKAADRAAYLMVEYAGAKLGPISTAGSDSSPSVNIPLRLSEVTRLCDIEIDAATTEKLLTPLGFKVQRSASSGNGNAQATVVDVAVPSFRAKDVTREVDVVEEIVRLYGYDKVPESMPKRTIAPPRADVIPTLVKQSLSAAGLNEAWISSLVAASDLNARGFLGANNETAVKVLNPLSEDHQALRQSLLPGLMKAVAYNHDRGQENVWLFEVGLTYHRDTSLPADKFNTGTREVQNVGGIITGTHELTSWAESSAAKPPSQDAAAREFYTLKGAVENLCKRLAISCAQVQFLAENETPGWFHPSRSCRIVFLPAGRDKKVQPQPVEIGWLGEVHPAVADAYGLKSIAAAFELNLDALRKVSSSTVFQDIYNTPTVVRDLTADVARSVAQASVMQLINQYGGRLLRYVELVSVFDLSDEKRSLSYRLTFQHADQTLTAEAVEDVINKIRAQLMQQLSAEFRS